MTLKFRTDADASARRQERLDGLFAEHGRAVLAYAVRRTAHEDDAADVLAETFLVAWRRLDDVPAGDAALMWLYGVARRVLANQQRGERRRRRLAERLGRELAAARPFTTPHDPVIDAVLEAVAELAPDDREVLLLAAWEELSAAEIGSVLGISQIAARSRLHRARKRLRAVLDADTGADQLSFQEAI